MILLTIAETNFGYQIEKLTLGNGTEIVNDNCSEVLNSSIWYISDYPAEAITSRFDIVFDTFKDAVGVYSIL